MSLLTDGWQRGSTSNFEYLMQINLLAGRCFDDLMQYPVLPWVLREYDRANVNLRVYDRSGHLPFIEQREGFVGEYLDFLDAVDGVKTSRELILDPSLAAIKSSSL